MNDALPRETRAALTSIAGDLRNLPRDCIGDRAELVHWLNRQARRIEAERDRKVVLPRPAPVRAVVAQTPVPMPPKPRTITSRRGKRVRVEVRRPVIQFEMEFGRS